MNDFSLSLIPDGEACLVTASSAAAGEAGPIRLEADALERWAQAGARLARGHVLHRRDAHEMGRKLFAEIFRDDILRLFIAARAGSCGSGLRLRIELPDRSVLHEAPWELLTDATDATDGRFLAIDPATPIVRYLRQPHAPRSLRVEPPLRVLFTSACPEGQPELDLNLEAHHVRTALEPLEEVIQLSVWHKISLEKLLHLWRRASHEGSPFHVWHHCGHGLLGRGGEFRLVLEEGGEARPVTLTQLGDAIAQAPDLRMAVLNVCSSGSSTGLAPQLARLDVPLVVGFRSAIFDRSALAFAKALYEGVTRVPVDVAVTQARNELAVRAEGPLDWTLPVVFSRTPDPLLLKCGKGDSDDAEDVGKPNGEEGIVKPEGVLNVKNYIANATITTFNA